MVFFCERLVLTRVKERETIYYVMKKLIITLVFLAFVSGHSFAQLQIDGKAIPGPEEVSYITVHGYAFNTSMRVFINFGQWDGRYDRRQQFQTNTEEPIAFRNAIQAVNYLAARGWELDESGIAISDDGFRVDLYVLKRKEPSEKEAEEADL